MNRRRLSRTVNRGTGRGESRTSLPKETGKHYRPDEAVVRADEMAGECCAEEGCVTIDGATFHVDGSREDGQ